MNTKHQNIVNGVLEQPNQIEIVDDAVSMRSGVSNNNGGKAKKKKRKVIK